MCHWPGSSLGEAELSRPRSKVPGKPVRFPQPQPVLLFPVSVPQRQAWGSPPEGSWEAGQTSTGLRCYIFVWRQPRVTGVQEVHFLNARTISVGLLKLNSKADSKRMQGQSEAILFFRIVLWDNQSSRSGTCSNCWKSELQRTEFTEI